MPSAACGKWAQSPIAEIVESVNKAGDHAAAKRIIGTTKTLTPEEAADPAFDLRGLAKR